MLFRQIFDPKLAQYAYLLGCQRTKEALVIDPQRDVDRYQAVAQSEGLRITAVAETHIHADFLSGARELAEKTGAKLYLSDEGDADWKYEWVKDGDYDVTLLQDGDSFQVGHVEIKAVHTPGHTPEHMSFLVTDHGSGMTEPMGIATGDFVFVSDLGRPDLLESAAGVEGAMEPSARRLYASVRSFLELPDFLQVWPAHGAGSICGKALGAVPTSTVGYERRSNQAIDAATRGEDHFVQMILEGQPEPPLYFGRMKRLNKEGVPLLGELPTPRPMTADELLKVAEQPGAVVLDTRLDRKAFMAEHLPGALYTPLNKSFPTITGSYLRPEEQIYLIVDEDRIDEAVRDLIRIGLDNIAGFASPQVLENLEGLVSTEVIDFDDLDGIRREEDSLVLDVRAASEYEAYHVPEAMNVAHTRLLDRLDEISKDRKLLVHCGSGSRAAAASALLERKGFDVGFVDDIISNYRASHEPTAAG
ncbi:MAG: MBL fold metallo-hydrolase [Acidobacteria bacterium]|nr:MBL fold metallo-hydrolase [Acidobacteriota bacterium]